MWEPIQPLLYALFVWWFGTGVVLYLDRLPGGTYRWSMAVLSALAALALVALVASADEGSTAAAYLAFTCAVVVWGWLELSYLLGLVTGPNKQPCPAGCSLARRFWLALQASLYHELAVLGIGVLMMALLHDAENPVGLWTYTVLWVMRWSAKLNVFLGVPNLNEDWLPEHLRFLGSYMGRKPMNLLFPVSVTAATVVAAGLLGGGASAAVAPAGQLLVGAMLVLAIVEHWCLVLPVQDAALWRWARPAERLSGRAGEPERAVGMRAARASCK